MRFILLILAALRVATGVRQADAAPSTTVSPPAQVPVDQRLKTLIARSGIKGRLMGSVATLYPTGSDKPVLVQIIGDIVSIKTNVAYLQARCGELPAVIARLEQINQGTRAVRLEFVRQTGYVRAISDPPLEGLEKARFKALVDQVGRTAKEHGPGLRALCPDSVPAEIATAAPASTGIDLGSLLKPLEDKMRIEYDASATEWSVHHPMLTQSWEKVIVVKVDAGFIGMSTVVVRRSTAAGDPSPAARRIDEINATIKEHGYFHMPPGKNAVMFVSRLPATGATSNDVAGSLLVHAATVEAYAAELNRLVPSDAESPAPASVEAPAGAVERLAEVRADVWRSLKSKRERVEKDYGYMYSFNAMRGVRYRFKLAAANGSGFDAFIVTDAERFRYQAILDSGSGTITSLDRRKGYERCTIEWAAPSDGRYALIIDNTRFPDGGAHFSGWFDVDIEIDWKPGR